MGSICRRLTAELLRWQAQPTSSFRILSGTTPYDGFVRSVSSSALRAWSADLSWPETCQEQRRCKAKAVRISKKAASKGMQSSLLEKKYQKQHALHVQDKITIDSPQIIIGYLDPLPHEMPWSWVGSVQWLWNRENRTNLITETVRSQQIKYMLKESYGQDEEKVLALCRSLYLKIKDAFPRHVLPTKYLTKECEDAMLKEFNALKMEGIRVQDFKPDGVPQARILQYRVFPVPKQKIVIFQVCLQLNTNEVHTISTPSDGFQDITLRYQPMWVLTKIASQDMAKAAQRELKEEFGGWKLSARILDHAVGRGEVGQRPEVPGMIPTGMAKKQINQVWEQMLFCVQNDGITWQSWMIRLALGLPKLC